MTELTQTLVNAVLLIAVTLIAGSIGLRRFEAVDRRFEAMDRRLADLRTELKADIAQVDGHVADLRTELKADIAQVDGHVADLRTELKADIAQVDGHVADVRTELAQARSDLTYVALAVGARGAEGSG